MKNGNKNKFKKTNHTIFKLKNKTELESDAIHVFNHWYRK